MCVRVDDPRQDGLPVAPQDQCRVRDAYLRGRPDGRDAAVLDDDHAAVNRLRAAAVDDTAAYEGESTGAISVYMWGFRIRGGSPEGFRTRFRFVTHQEAPVDEVHMPGARFDAEFAYVATRIWAGGSREMSIAGQGGRVGCRRCNRSSRC